MKAPLQKYGKKLLLYIHESLNIAIGLPRLTSKQKNRPNYATSDIQKYYRVSIFIPLLENILEDLSFRFTKILFDALEVNTLLPKYFNLKSVGEIKRLKVRMSHFLQPFLHENVDFILAKVSSEIDMWIHHCSEKFPDTIFEAFVTCNQDIYPTLKVALQIVCTMPVSVASAERSFSTLKRIKTWLRSNMSQERL